MLGRLHSWGRHFVGGRAPAVVQAPTVASSGSVVVDEASSSLRKARALLVAHRPESSSRTVPRRDSIEFAGERYHVLRELGSGEEGAVYAVTKGGRGFVLKNFFDDVSERVFTTHLRVYEYLASVGVPTSRVLGWSLEDRQILFAATDGLTKSELRSALRGHPALYERLLAGCADYADEVATRHGARLAVITGDPNWLFLVPDQFLYQPQTDRWVIVDTH